MVMPVPGSRYQVPGTWYSIRQDHVQVFRIRGNKGRWHDGTLKYVTLAVGRVTGCLRDVT